MQQLTTVQAMSIVREACAAFKGDWTDHTKIQTALQVIETSLPKRQRKQTAKQDQ